MVLGLPRDDWRGIQRDLVVDLLPDPSAEPSDRVPGEPGPVREALRAGLACYGTVTVHIRRLREKLEADPARPQHLQTVWGVGYRLDP